jgi:tripartite-type tricarboxylate transporter receptor subunit TctC
MQKQIHFFLKDAVKITFILALVGLAASLSWGAEYPTRPIQLIIGYAPGSTDMNVKPFIEKMPEFVGQPMAFVYKPGASGTMGASFVAHSRPDGYTLFIGSTSPIILGPLTKENLDYSIDSFAPICRLVTTPVGIAVKADSPLKTVKDLVDAAKASPGKLTYSTSGTYGIGHISMELFAKALGIRLNHIPTTGSLQAVTACLGGHVDMTHSDSAPLMPHLNSGALRYLVVMGNERLSFAPDVPTASEIGYPVSNPVWYGIFGPRALPKPIIEKIYSSAKKAYEQYKDTIEERVRNIGLQVTLMGPEEMDREARAQKELIRKAMKDLSL